MPCVAALATAALATATAATAAAAAAAYSEHRVVLESVSSIDLSKPE